MSSAGRDRPSSSSSSTRSCTWLSRHDAVDPERPRDVVLDALGGIQRPERVLEDHLHLRAVAAKAAAARDPAHVLGAEHDRARRRRVEPRQQPGDRALAAAALADERRDRPGRSVKLTSSTARRTPRRRRRPRRSPEREVLRQPVHLERPRRDRASGAVSSMRRTRSRPVRRWQATEWPSVDGHELRPNADLEGVAVGVRAPGAVRAARMEPAAARRAREIGRRAGDARHPHALARERRERARSARACTDAAASCEAALGRRELDDLARVHDRDPVARARRAARGRG